ncbi:MAG: adenylyltransferase/cytidyltransferase family protein [Nanoarchaeota archaeon]
MENKIKTTKEIKEIAENLREEGKTIVTTNGSFDILHYAHVNLFQKAKKLGDILIVLLNSDSSIKKNKGDKRPIIGQDERAFMISALECVDYIVIFEEDKPLSIIKEIKPHKHVKGGSFIKDRVSEEKELISSWEGDCIYLDLEEGFSTTNIIDKIIKTFKN